jgi:hypothetical protein
MYGLTRGAITLVGVIVAGFLIWFGVDPLSGESVGRGEFWWAVLMCALAGFVIALSQVLGGWTKWGWPRLSAGVFLLGFLPVLVAGGWVLLARQPADFFNTSNWSRDLGIDGAVGSLGELLAAIAFGVGLVFGLTFDTSGPRRDVEVEEHAVARTRPAPVPVAGETDRDHDRVHPRDADEPLTAEREADPDVVEHDRGRRFGLRRRDRVER